MLSDDALVAVCLCTRLGRGAQVVPLTVREWTDLVLTLHREQQATPASLIDNPGSDRVAELLRGLASVGLELERLRSNRVWVLTRGDEDYPRFWKRDLGAEAPPVVFGAGPREALSVNLVAITGVHKPDEAPAIRAWARLCAADGWGVVTDRARLAVDTALGEGGFAVEVVADSLEHALAKKFTREAVLSGRLTVLSPYSPSAPFTAARGAECARLAEALARHALKGGSGPPLAPTIDSAFADRGQTEFDL